MTTSELPIKGHPDLAELSTHTPATSAHVDQAILDRLYLVDTSDKLVVADIPSGASVTVKYQSGESTVFVKDPAGDTFTEYLTNDDGEQLECPQTVMLGTTLGPVAGMINDGVPTIAENGYLQRGVRLTFRAGETDKALEPFSKDIQAELERFVTAFDLNPEELEEHILAANLKMGIVVRGDDDRLYWSQYIEWNTSSPVESFEVELPKQD